jgi:hypothetical protein
MPSARVLPAHAASTARHQRHDDPQWSVRVMRGRDDRDFRAVAARVARFLPGMGLRSLLPNWIRLWWRRFWSIGTRRGVTFGGSSAFVLLLVFLRAGVVEMVMLNEVRTNRSNDGPNN